MDLSTMAAKLEEGMYKDRSAFEADLRLMVANARQYNIPGSFVHNEAIALETFFEKRKSIHPLASYVLTTRIATSEWTIINKTLEAADKAHASAAPPVPPPVPRLVARPPPTVPAHKPSPVPVVVPSPPTAVAQTTPAAPRPVIKLKVGSQSKAVDPVPVQPAPKPRGRKMKPITTPAVEVAPIDAPPPPYVDDGSHDILQEVLAIEREKDEKRQRSTSEKERDRIVVPNGVPGKRKKSDSSIDEDDILALATPAKKEKPSPPGPSTSASTKPKIVISTPQPQAITVSEKPQKDKYHDAAPTRTSSKGKEKEILPPVTEAPTPKSKKATAAQAIPFNEKKCKDLLKALQRLPEAIIFARPVDPIADGCPT